MGLGSKSTASSRAGLGAFTGTSCLDDGKAGSSQMGSKASSEGLETGAVGFSFLGLFFLGAGLTSGVVCRGLRRSPGLSPRDPSKGVAGFAERYLFTTFLVGSWTMENNFSCT